jgi:hypothetical protein
VQTQQGVPRSHIHAFLRKVFEDDGGPAGGEALMRWLKQTPNAALERYCLQRMVKDGWVETIDLGGGRFQNLRRYRSLKPEVTASDKERRESVLAAQQHMRKAVRSFEVCCAHLAAACAADVGCLTSVGSVWLSRKCRG